MPRCGTLERWKRLYPVAPPGEERLTATSPPRPPAAATPLSASGEGENSERPHLTPLCGPPLLCREEGDGKRRFSRQSSCRFPALWNDEKATALPRPACGGPPLPYREGRGERRFPRSRKLLRFSPLRKRRGAGGEVAVRPANGAFRSGASEESMRSVRKSICSGGPLETMS